MATFTRASRGYSLEAFSQFRGGQSWTLDSSRCTLLVHDLLPYYLGVLDPELRERTVENCDQIAQRAMAAQVPVLASGPRPASDIAQRGLGGTPLGTGAHPG